MATLRNIKHRIVGVKSTQQITRAMKMVAATKLRKSQQRLLNTRPYADELARVLGHVKARSGKTLHPLFEIRPSRRVCYVLISSDKGLCGGFNANLIRRARQELEKSAGEAEESFLMTIGRKGYKHFKRREQNIAAHWLDLFNHLEFKHAHDIAVTLLRFYEKKKLDRIYIIYSRFKSAVRQEIVVEQVLPIKAVKPVEEAFPVNFIYEPSPYMILDHLCPMSIKFQLWRMLLESSTSEFGARMTAMESATDNAEERIKELTLSYNKARQAAITKEITEIVAGAEALKG
ncbi:ATP synthase F1 subunit gamma [candidate division KSB1 bacterium]|nr:ATP synthase F1 subunit gamma [candidate division KSB1 bacterium]